MARLVHRRRGPVDSIPAGSGRACAVKPSGSCPWTSCSVLTKREPFGFVNVLANFKGSLNIEE